MWKLRTEIIVRPIQQVMVPTNTATELDTTFGVIETIPAST